MTSAIDKIAKTIEEGESAWTPPLSVDEVNRIIEELTGHKPEDTTEKEKDD